jgi:chromosome partitioning protein
MTLIIACVSQKGGVGKSTVARMLAREYAANEWSVKIADMDNKQLTSTRWNARRNENGFQPELEVQNHKTVSQALRTAESYDLLVFDGKPHSSAETLEIAKQADIIIIPTGYSLDDLEPTITLANDLVKGKINRQKIHIIFSRTGNSEAEAQEAREYVQAAGYRFIDGELPERTTYRRASDLGKAATETTHPSTNQYADQVVQKIVDRINELQK